MMFLEWHHWASEGWFAELVHYITPNVHNRFATSIKEFEEDACDLFVYILQEHFIGIMAVIWLQLRDSNPLIAIIQLFQFQWS